MVKSTEMRSRKKIKQLEKEVYQLRKVTESLLNDKYKGKVFEFVSNGEKSKITCEAVEMIDGVVNICSGLTAYTGSRQVGGGRYPSAPYSYEEYRNKIPIHKLFMTGKRYVTFTVP